MTRRGELFPADPALTARIVAAAVLTPALVVAALAALVVLAPLKLSIAVAVLAAIGVGIVVRERAEAVRGREVAPAEAPELHAVVERLCVMANLAKPRIVVEREAQPNSWVVALGRGRARLHLTEGLLERLEPSELEAVIAHELAHVAHRDATVMTIVGGPAAVLLHGGRSFGFGWPMGAAALVATAIGWLGSVGARVLSRYRELAADAGAVALTGNPAALASALMKVSDGLAALPSRDLRAVAARDAFHLLPVAREQPTRLPLPPTHPSLKARIARLQQIESKLQSAR